jgi:hypothetical protein
MDYEEVFIHTRDNQRLQCWLIKQKQHLSVVPTVLYFHANAGNIGLRMQQYVILHEKIKCNIMAVSYRGYGESTGEPVLTSDGLDELHGWSDNWQWWLICFHVQSQS